MKKILLYTLPLLAAMTACKDLDKYPLDSVNSASYFKTESQLEQYSNQFYAMFPSASSMYNEVSDEISITELADEARGGTFRDVPTSSSGTSWTWSDLRHINYLIEHVNQCTDPVAAKEYDGLARFFRAYFYYNKIRHYGDVPWIDHTLGNNDDKLMAPRDDRKMVMQNVIADLDTAIKYMTDDRTNVYRVNRYTAMALKSRICLFEGTFRKYHNLGDWKPMLEQAASAAEQLIDLKYYQLYESPTDKSQSYREVFTLGTVTGCNEYILARCYNLNLALNHDVSNFTTSTNTGRPGFTKRFVNQYLMADGTRFTDQTGWDKMDIGTEMKNRDPRMAQTMLWPGHYIRMGESKVAKYDATVSSTGYQLIKYVMDASTMSYNHSDCDMPLFRIAEVYLNFAEAKAELGTFTQDDADKSINLLRKRALMPDMDVANIGTACQYMKSLYPNVSSENTALILEVRRERDIELVQEGFRYWDLIRWKEGKAFCQPYLGMYFPGVSKTQTDPAGRIDSDGNGSKDLCVWVNQQPKFLKVTYLKLGRDINLSNGKNGGNVICNCGVIDTTTYLSKDPIDGRVWNEERDYFYPIPLEEITITNGAIKQNPGW